MSDARIHECRYLQVNGWWVHAAMQLLAGVSSGQSGQKVTCRSKCFFGRQACAHRLRCSAKGSTDFYLDSKQDLYVSHAQNTVENASSYVGCIAPISMSSHDPGLHQNLQISVSLGKLFLLLRREGTIAMVRAMVMHELFSIPRDG